MIPEQFKLKNTIKYPTSLIIGGLSKLGLEIADSLIEQGGYVIIVDTFTQENTNKLDVFPKDSLISLVDYTSIPHLDEELRRLDYVFYFGHESTNYSNKVSTQQFLSFSNYLDATLSLASKFEAKFLMTTAIKAHQLVVSNEQLGANFGPGIEVKHAVYTDMELQRYAEGLTLEYVEKTDLDARIIRLGEIIGDGIDFAAQTVFTDLIVSAAKGETLKLSKDGLESEWLVHVLDAAYGIIKAQFSKNTKGQIYSVCYDNTYTHLSIAYKIQELEERAAEIQFIEEKDNIPALKLYKPAPNLSQIGWTTRVQFDKAVKQSIAAAKIYLLENSDEGENKGVVGKLKDFLTLADNRPNISDTQLNGPISKLIAERRRQEELRQQSMDYAANSIKAKRRYKPRTFTEKFRNWFWTNFISLGNTFSFFKNKTPGEFALMILISLVFIFIYIFVLSPAFVILKDTLVILPEYDKMIANINSGNYLGMKSSAEAVKSSLDDMSYSLSKYEWIANSVALNKEYYQLKNIIDSYVIVADGVKNIGYSFEPYNEYLSNYKNNTQIRAATDSFLSITDNGIDYSNMLLEFKDRTPYLQLGIDKINKGVDQLKITDYNKIPPFLTERILTVNNSLQRVGKLADTLKSSEQIPDLLGAYDTRTYLMLLFDNTRLKPVGGEISAFALVTLKNGSVSEVVVQSPDEIKFNYSKVTESLLKDINNRKYTYKTLSDLNINDIGNIYNYSTYSDVINQVFSTTFNRKIHGVISLNYSTLDRILTTLRNSAGQIYKVEVNGVGFENGNILNNLKLSQVGNESLQTKHRITAQVLAATIFNLLSNIKENSSPLFTILSSESLTQGVLVNASNLEYSKYVDNDNLNAKSVLQTDSYAAVGLNIEDFKIVTLDKYPSVSTATDVKIAANFSLIYKMNIKFPNIGVSQEVSTCLPLSVPNSNIQAQGIPGERVVINTGNSEKCVVFKVISESEATIQWVTSPIGGNVVSDVYTIDLGMGKIRGTNSVSDYKIGLDPSLKLVSIEPYVATQNNSAIFTENLLTDQIIKIQIKR